MTRPRTALALGGIVAVFVAAKVRDLTLPYFWDELGVYARAALYLHDHGPSIMPRALPAELSRGHPLLLACAFAASFRAFGATPLVAHLTMLALAVGLVLSVYHVARVHFGTAAALAAAALLVVQPIFFAQSTLLLPELPLAVAALWTLHFFERRRDVATALCATVAVLIKETALVLSLVLCLVAAGQWLASRRSLGAAVRSCAALTVSAVVYGLFLVVQKRQNGWYLFPLHERAIDLRWAAVGPKLLDFASFLFCEQGRFLLSAAAVVAIAIRLRSKPWPAASALGIGATFTAFAAGYLLFSSANFFMKRYVLCLVPPLVIMAGHALVLLTRARPAALAAAVGAILVAQLPFMNRGKFNFDYDMSFRRQVIFQREVTHWLEQNIGYHANIQAAFPFIFGLEDRRLGYASYQFLHTYALYFWDINYIVASELDDHFVMPPVKPTLIRTFAEPGMTVRIYRAR
jgi:4-amino-4-deoxy-L-arabinose transferase-like glycosyltransferase